MQKCIIVQQPERRLENKQNWLFGEGDPPPRGLNKKKSLFLRRSTGLFSAEEGGGPPPPRTQTLGLPCGCPPAAPSPGPSCPSCRPPPPGKGSRASRGCCTTSPGSGCTIAPSPSPSLGGCVQWEACHCPLSPPRPTGSHPPPPRAQHPVFVIPSPPC